MSVQDSFMILDSSRGGFSDEQRRLLHQLHFSLTAAENNAFYSRLYKVPQSCVKFLHAHGKIRKAEYGARVVYFTVIMKMNLYMMCRYKLGYNVPYQFSVAQ